MIKADASAVFCNLSDFAETATYHPRGRLSRPVRAVIVRDVLAILPEDGDTVTPVSEIHIAATGEFGITSEELDTGGDCIEFDFRIGREKRLRPITRLISHDEGMLVVECR